MATKIYGQSDDLIEFDGDVSGEVGCYGTHKERHEGVLIACSDGTLLSMRYSNGFWLIRLLALGDKLERIYLCANASEDADPGSDVAHFRDGLTYAYAAKGNWERVR